MRLLIVLTSFMAVTAGIMAYRVNAQPPARTIINCAECELTFPCHRPCRNRDRETPNGKISASDRTIPIKLHACSFDGISGGPRCHRLNEHVHCGTNYWFFLPDCQHKFIIDFEDISGKPCDNTSYSPTLDCRPTYQSRSRNSGAASS